MSDAGVGPFSSDRAHRTRGENHTGDVPGLPATGKPFRISGAGVGEIRDGKLARVTEYWNMAEFLIQIGVLPTPGA